MMTLQIRCTVPTATTAIQRQSRDAGREPNFDYLSNIDDTIFKRRKQKVFKNQIKLFICRCKVFRNS